MEYPNHEMAFREAFEKHSDELFRHCHVRLSDRERALELTQECFLRAWEFVARGNDIEHYRPFLYRVLNNLIIDEYRKKKMQSLDAMLENEETMTSVENDYLRDETDELQKAMDRFDGQRALEALRSLPEAYKVVVTMRFIDGLTPQEIASILKESENTVSVRIHRGLKKLNESLTTPIRP